MAVKAIIFATGRAKKGRSFRKTEESGKAKSYESGFVSRKCIKCFGILQ